MRHTRSLATLLFLLFYVALGLGRAMFSSAIVSMNSENSRLFPEVLYWLPGVLQCPGLVHA